MPKPAPLDDPKTYQNYSDAAYAKRMAQGVQNPKAVLAARESEAENTQAAPPQNSPASAIPGVKFTRGFTSEERAAQKRALAKKLAERDAEDAKDEK